RAGARTKAGFTGELAAVVVKQQYPPERLPSLAVVGGANAITGECAADLFGARTLTTEKLLGAKDDHSVSQIIG
ncbi:MAG: hypothetical protein JXA30_20695, partial [Deltaproteobacteria bacterium]|nr:hypothetical protein [Deltaproteobacteria bacterium]